MSRLTWTERKYHSGVDRGVVYSRDGSVETWNGLISVAEKPTDIRERVRYRDGVRSINHRSEDSFAATIECFTYPLSLFSTVPRTRPGFDMSYRTKTESGYEIHLIYNAVPRINGVTYKQNEHTPLTIDISTRPMMMPLSRAPSAHLIINTSTVYPGVLVEFEQVLYGGDDSDPRMPLPDDLISLFDVNALFRVIDNGDGTATLIAPDEVFEWFNATQGQVDWPYVNRVAPDTVRIRNF